MNPATPDPGEWVKTASPPCAMPEITEEEWIASTQSCCGVEPDGWADPPPQPPAPPTGGGEPTPDAPAP